MLHSHCRDGSSILPGSTMEKEKIQSNIIYPIVKTKHVLSLFWQGLEQQKWMFFFCVFFIVLANIFSVITPLFYKKFFDVIAIAGDQRDTASQLIRIIIQIGILNLCIWVFYRVAVYLNIVYGADTMARLKQQAYDYLMQHSYRFFSNSFTGSLVQRVNRFAKAFETFADQISWHVLPMIIRIASITIVVYFTNKWIALIIFLWAIFFLTFNVVFSQWKVKYDIVAAAQDSKTTGYLSDTVANQNTIQLFSGFKFESQGFKDVSDKQAKATKLSWNLDSISDGVQSFLIFLIEFLLFFFAIKYWELNLITAGVFVLLQIYIISLIDQLWGFSRVIRQFYQAYADSKEMAEIMLLPHEIVDKPIAKELIAEESLPAGRQGKINFDNLSFNFNATRSVLKNINLEIKPGERVALIGPSGAGKTTFVKLLLRMYEPTEGKILIDDQDVSEVTQESLRKNIAMVPQDTILFHRTLVENIAYGNRDADRKEIEKAVRLAHCDEFVKNLPMGLDTYVGERGVKLSGGERQRVAIARAILKNAPILILDEATSSLDSQSELLIQDALENLMKNKTVIVIAHRLSTIQKMDRIIVVDKGQIIEQGSHKELLEKKNSLYKKLWELQAGGFMVSDNEKEEDDPTSTFKDQNSNEVEEEDNNDDDEENIGESPHPKAKLTSF